MAANQRAIPGAHRFRLGIVAVLVLGPCLGVTGCAEAPAGAPAAAPVPVAVSYPVERDVTDYADFTARTAAIFSVTVIARVTGYLDRVYFADGAEVEKDDLLFQIDPRPYRADLDRARANLLQAEAHMHRLERDQKRATALHGRGAISQEEIDRIAGDYAEAQAAVGMAKAARDLAELNLSFTQVKAPIAGRLSRRMADPGNLVRMDETALTSIVSHDPMHAYFDMDEGTVQRVRQLVREGKARSARETEVPVSLGLATEEGFPHQGTVNFADNQVNPRTGTLRVRGVFPNEDEVLSPGFFARVRVPIGPPHRALLVSDRALDNDQGQKVLYVLNDRDEVASRPVRVGALHDGLRAIEDGLEPGERVIVNGLQQVRPGITVEPKLVAMPTSEGGGKDRRPSETARRLKAVENGARR